MTPVDYIALALRAANVLGTGQTADAQDTQDVLVVLQAMLNQWSRKKFLTPNEIDTAFTATGATNYSIGSGGNFNIARPDRVEAAYIRLLPAPTAAQQVDIPLGIVDAHEDWATVATKSIVGFPQFCFLDSAYPLSHLYIYPVASASSCEVHIITKYAFPTTLTLSQDIDLPPEYTDAIIWNLAVRVRPLYGAGPDPTIIALAKTSLNVIRGANCQIPVLRMPRGIGWYGGGRWGGHGIRNYASLG
jgi:hypothetical protein